jgi:DNA-binding transcriptional MerR regulator
MGTSVPSLDRESGLLKIGEAATLTGVSPGRIRHYQSQGLVRPSRSLSGYRYFNADDLVRILQIDLLRSLGMGLTDIRASLPGQSHGESLRETLAIHRNTLRAERDRLDRLLAAVETALTSEDASAESVATLLASANSTPRDSLGIFGRLSRPLSEEAALIYQEILGGGWGLPVPSIFGRMLLPPPVSDLLEQVAHTNGYTHLFSRIRDLAVEIIGLATRADPDPNGPVDLASQWLESLLTDPLPPEVQTALDRTVPRIRELEVLNQGFQLWAESISPQAAEVLRALERLAERRSLLVLGVLVAPRTRRRGSARARTGSN